MAKVPLPDRGQPLDLSYIYQLADAVNNLSNELSPTTARYITIDTPVGPVSADCKLPGRSIALSLVGV